MKFLTVVSHLHSLPCFLLATWDRRSCPPQTAQTERHFKKSWAHRHSLPLAAARKSISSSHQERREEEKRRQERASDVVIGKTSAISDAYDYKFDVSSTEEQWLQQASKVEQEVFKQTDRGMECLSMLQL